jgi:hypothetical protein
MVGPVSPVSNVLLSSYVDTQTKYNIITDPAGGTKRIDTTVFRTVYYEYSHGTVSVKNVSSSSQNLNMVV